MRAVLREVPASLADERARIGADRFDEMWEGTLHMAPAPGYQHQSLGSELLLFLGRVLSGRGIKVLYQTEVHRPGAGGQDYRIPDLVAFRADQPGLVVSRGLEGAPLCAIEILSPDDETYDKLDFYAALGVPEVIVLAPATRAVEIFRLAGTRYLAVSADERGRTHAASIDARFATLAGESPRLRVESGGESVDL